MVRFSKNTLHTGSTSHFAHQIGLLITVKKASMLTTLCITIINYHKIYVSIIPITLCPYQRKYNPHYTAVSVSLSVGLWDLSALDVSLSEASLDLDPLFGQ